MPTLLTAHNHRLAFLFGQDRDEWLSGSCKSTGLRIPSGVSVQFQIGVYEDLDTGTFYDFSDIANARAQIKKMRAGDNRPRPEDPTYADEPIATFDATTITAAGWADGSEQHATFAFDPSETGLDPGGYWLVFSGFTTAGKFVSFGWGRIEIVQDGTGIVSPVQPLDPSYYTAAQIDDWRQTTGLTPTHNYYANHYSSLPASVPFSGAGTVLSYTLLGTTRYRFIPSPYDPVEDAFYESFSDPTLSGLIVRLSLN